MTITAQAVKELRERTGAGMMDCKKALTEAGGDFDKAEKILKELGLAAAAKRGGRATNEGRVFTSVTDKSAAILEISCETDFVAKNEDFMNFTKDVCLQIAAMNPEYISSEDVPEEVINKEKEILREQLKD